MAYTRPVPCISIDIASVLPPAPAQKSTTISPRRGAAIKASTDATFLRLRRQAKAEEPRIVPERAPAGSVEPPVQPEHATALPPPQPTPPPVDQAALERQRERLGMLAARANAVRGSLQNLEQQQRGMGLGLRGDISSSWKRMEFLLDEAEAALKRQDPAAARALILARVSGEAGATPSLMACPRW